MRATNIKSLLASLVALLVTLPSWSADGDTFTANTVEGVEMTFRVINENEKTCQVGTGRYGDAISSSYSGTITIPSSANGYTVTEIGYNAFRDCRNLTSITIPSSVTSIGSSAFYYCLDLTSITIPESVTSIGDAAFRDCWNLTSITIPSSVTSIGSSAFNNCQSLTSITIPSSVTSIRDATFYRCSGLISITISSSVTSIGEYAFSNCTGLTSVTIPSGVTSIGSSAFSYCSGLTSITIPESVTSIGGRAFENCTNLTSVTINSDAIASASGYSSSGTISNYFGNQVEEYIIGDAVKTIGGYAFYGTENLKKVQIGKSVTRIGGRAFCESGVTSVSLSEGLREIGVLAFEDCPLTEVTIPSTVTSMEEGAFYCETMRTVILKSNPIVAANYTEEFSLEGFFGSYVSEYILGTEVKSIGRYAFAGCTGMRTIVMSENMDRIRDNAFAGCDELEDVRVENPEPPVVAENAFTQDAYKYAILYVPEGSQEAYKADEVWKKFSRVRTQDYGMKDCMLAIRSAAGGCVKQTCKTKTSHTFVIKPETGWKVSSVSFNGEDVTANVATDGTYTTPSLTGDSELSIVFEQDGNAVKDVEAGDQLRVRASGSMLFIDNEGNEVQVDIYTTDGKQVKNIEATNGTTSVSLQTGNIYLIRIGERTFKVAM